MSTEMWVVDRIEGSVAVLVSDDGQTVNVDRTDLVQTVTEGDVLRIDVSDDPRRDWSNARVLRAETQERRDAAEAQLNRLRKRDPGGDVEL